MRVAIISHCFPPYFYKGGGVATYAFNLASSLAESGVEVSVFCGAPKRGTETHGNLTINRLPLTLGSIPPNFVWFQLQNIPYLKNRLKEYDLIHTQSTTGTLISLLSKSISLKSHLKQKWVTTYHSCHQRELNALYLYLLHNGRMATY